MQATLAIYNQNLRLWAVAGATVPLAIAAAGPSICRPGGGARGGGAGAPSRKRLRPNSGDRFSGPQRCQNRYPVGVAHKDPKAINLD